MRCLKLHMFVLSLILPAPAVYISIYDTESLRFQMQIRGVAAGFGHHGMPPPGCNNIAAILLMSWATLLPILIILRLFVLELWAGRVRHTM